jgi:acyl-CoA thioester hydrolase
MLSHETIIRVRYGETDKMGVVYYGVYPLYFEVGRTELMRKYGISYRELEEQGIQMPVINMECTYLKPAFYDDIIYVKTFVKELPERRIKFEYEIYNYSKELINKASTTLIFLNVQTEKPSRAPLILIKKIQGFF